MNATFFHGPASGFGPGARRAGRVLAALALAAAAGVSMAAATDLSTTPIASASTISAKPNIMFLLDDSGSMNWSYMPDAMGGSIGASDTPFVNTYGYSSTQCNGVAYDPSYTYQPPVKPDGALMANAAFGSARSDGFVATSAAVNLANSSYYKYTGAQSAMAWTYNAGGVIKTSTFYKECLSIIGNAPGSSVFTKVTLTGTSPEAQNYANWYSYYRKRYLTMRSGAGRAFAALDANYRVGFSVISDTGVTTGSNNFLDTADFDSTQKNSFYDNLYTSPSTGGTPLRQSLSKIGQYFAKKVSGQTYDPMQYSCQRDYVILATDGSWNGAAGTRLDRVTAIGQQDGTEDRPMFDGNYAASTVLNTWRTYEWDVYSAAGSFGCSGSKYATVIWPLTMTETDQVANGVTMPAFTGSYTGSTYSIVCKTAAELAAEGLTGGSPFASGLSYLSSSGTTYTPTPSQLVISSSGSTPAGTGPFDTLADVAGYYYKTDLRSSTLGNCTGALGLDVCSDTLLPLRNSLDIASWQHMTTYTVGLGINGTLAFDREYLKNPTAGVYGQLRSGAINWPVPDGGAANVDDLWHAAVNGRGRYFSASNSDLLSQSIVDALAEAKASVTVSSGVGATSLQPVSGDNNQVYLATFNAIDWSGDLKAYPIDATTGAVDTTVAPVWSAQAKLDATASTDRAIYYRKPSGGALTPFTYSNLSLDGYNTLFDNICSKTSVAAQCPGLSATQRIIANAGVTLVSYLRGENTYEAQTNASNPLYRQRLHKLGDIVNASPVYVGKRPFVYADSGYATFRTAQASRKPMVYAASNDGMLHAFSADPAGSDKGTELWAYIPSMVMPELYRLADSAYPSKHRFFVDGTPVVGDIQVGGVWKTILVGGLNSGGKGYYALDITNPAAPLSLWEFTDTNLGLSYGNPVITKRADGTWVVAVTSGHNNADGKGHLFVLDANTGAKLAGLDLITTAGTPTSPSGLAELNAWIDEPTDNTALRFYAGDLLGNLWRFDIDNRIPPAGNEATLLATFQVSASVPQPITTAPQPVQVASGSYKYPAVVVATGRLLGAGDIPDTTRQTIYVVKDTLAATGLGNVRASTSLVSQTVTVSGNTSTITNNPVDWSTMVGWKLDLPNSRERVIVNPIVQFNTVAVVSAVPGNACLAASSWFYQLDVGSGTTTRTDSAGSVFLGNSLVVGAAWIQVKDATGKIRDKLLATDTSGLDDALDISTSAGSTGLRRTSWRELVN